MMADQPQAARQLCETGRRLYERGFFAATEGNLSCRIGPERVLCTPTAVSKGAMAPGDLCVVDLSGGLQSGTRQPTSEIALHLEIYRCDPQTAAVVHCHPPYATALAVSGAPLPAGVLAEAEFFLGEVPTIPYHRPGTPALADAIRPHAPCRRCAILQNHGAVSWDRDLQRASWSMEILEATCRAVILARTLGQLAVLPPEEIAQLRALGAGR